MVNLTGGKKKKRPVLLLPEKKKKKRRKKTTDAGRGGPALNWFVFVLAIDGGKEGGDRSH